MHNYNGEPYTPYSEYFASPAAQRPVVSGRRPAHASDSTPNHVATNATSRPPSSSFLSELNLDFEVDRVDYSIEPSTERSSASEMSRPGLT
ncbi:hypothetical protein HPB50_025165 [Hyalomma asiaticum]|uniref:Uncharacterized protein n=1 Tax=Hyalomma asiaticum TaxID=266040 RepID=A0ACB7RQ88_HYAAI|nr:hypothetical protein HPB50_025165 [Hyalomma asiaticum]